ncbi:MAG: dihydrofolate reductase family protein [Halodesulfovibrio sp.]|uniref:dihydrofolate reductase family protein n=1 Tax=Halodesulfovibrio sp. TaxID=1912772 RepID=UPI00359E079A
MPNFVFIGASIDGYIADRNNKLDFLECIPNPENVDFGFQDFMQSVDCVIMGRNTFETILGVGGEWHYSKPVFVLSSSLTSVPDKLKDNVEIMQGEINDIITALNKRGFSRLYIDGANVIQSFLKKDIIDEVIISTVPMLLGGGTKLFGMLPAHLSFEHMETQVLLNALVQTRYKRKKE